MEKSSSVSASGFGWSVIIGIIAGFLAFNNGGGMESVLEYFINILFWLTVIISIIGVLAFIGGMSTSSGEFMFAGLLIVFLSWVSYFVEVLVAKGLYPWFANISIDFTNFWYAIGAGGLFGLVVGFVSSIVMLVVFVVVFGLLGLLAFASP